MNSSVSESSIIHPEHSNHSVQDEISKSKVNLHYNPPNKKSKFCWFYNNYGQCKFGRHCNFIHATFSRHRRGRGNKIVHGKINGASATYNSKSSVKPGPQPPENNCRFFQAGYCHEASCSTLRVPCSISAEIKFDSQNVSIDEEFKQDSSANDTCNELETPSLQNNNTMKSKSDTLDDLETKRNTEIFLLRKRYPQLNHVQENNKDIFEITFSSSDPDWVFAVKFIQVQITLEKSYPKEVCEITVLDKNKEMPPLLLRYLNNSIKQWLLERHKSNEASGNYELVLRPFFKWLDRNLENIFVQGLRKVKKEIEAEKAGFEFVPHELLPGAMNNLSLESENKANNEDKQANKETNSEISLNAEEKNTSTKQDEVITLPNDKSAIPNCINNEQINATVENPSSSSKRGTEVKLIGLELTEGTASLECKKIFISLNCMRCKTSKELLVLPKQCHSTSCAKCHQIMQMTFQPSLLHQYSNVLGYLHLFDCQVVDLPLPQCTFFIDCLNCNKRNDVDGIHYGQMWTSWCLYCHQKLCLIVQTCKFQHLQPALKTGKPITVPSEKKVKFKDIALEFGKPLPKNGTCVHYKKSHRWLRFPCCGKLYPCDICHNEAETEHEMKYASRMICGFCSKEQPYSLDKPCISCLSFTTRKSGKHWEGGKGCRDHLRMCRDDRQKYAGMNKTVSRKASQQQKPKKKT